MVAVSLFLSAVRLRPGCRQRGCGSLLGTGKSYAVVTFLPTRGYNYSEEAAISISENHQEEHVIK